MNQESIKQSLTGRFAVCPVVSVQHGTINHFNPPVNLNLVQTFDLCVVYEKRPAIKFYFQSLVIYWYFENDQQRFETWSALVEIP